jgi:site-specific recombinase XerD
MRFSEAIHRFSTWRLFKVKTPTVKGYDKELRYFCLFLRNPEIEGVRLDDVMDYLAGLRELGWKQNSFVPKCMALRKFFEFCRLEGQSVLNEELIPIPRKQYEFPRVATTDAYARLQSVIPKNNDARHIRNRAIIDMLWDTGARSGEIVALDVNDLDLNAKKALIKTEKSRGRRPVRELFWTSNTNEILGRWLDTRSKLPQKDPSAVFVSTCTSRVGKRFTIKGVAEMLRRYSNRAKIPYVNAHSFRHHMGHDIIQQGGSSADVMNILGHSTLASSTVYTMMTDRELEERYRKFKGR